MYELADLNPGWYCVHMTILSCVCTSVDKELTD